MTKFPRSSAFIAIVAVFILLNVNVFQASGPTVDDCKDHIDAALRDFVAGQPESHQTTNEDSNEAIDVQEQSTEDKDSQETESQHNDQNNSEEKESNDDSKEDEKPDENRNNGEDEVMPIAPGVEVTDETEKDKDGLEDKVDESQEEQADNSKEEIFQDKDNDDDDDDDEHDDVSIETSSTRDRRDTDTSKHDAGPSEDTSNENQEGTIEGSNVASVTEANDNETERSTTEHSKETEEESDQSEEKDDEDDDEVISIGPGELKSREIIETILGVSETETPDTNRERVANEILKDVKKMYENAIKPLEQLYKYKDISNRHIGDAEIFSKPMILFMGPSSTGKSAIINYLLGTEYSRHALKTGAEPTSNSFTVVTYGETDQVLEGTQIAADWAFSTLQKFGQTFLERLKGRKLPNRLLQKMTIVDTPGVFENRKSPAERQRYPFNDAFQWFIDRADLIYVVFDPSKLDVGPEMEALFDQLKGRESHIRILLNKVDMVKPRELMKVQSTLLWNLLPEMSTSEAPTVFVGSFWSRPYLPGSPITLLDAQEEAFLEDLAAALDSRVETKVALARRHAVRVRNHAKMVDCYLKTYYDHKSFFGNRRKIADDIVDNPHEYHIYEGLSTMTNVSRYDLPDPEVYREFFRLHPLFDFKPLASTCSYFKGCPLDKLDIVIAYDLPELVGKYQKLLSSNKPTTYAPPPPSKGPK